MRQRREAGYPYETLESIAETIERQKRWVSYSRGLIRLNWRIIQAPRPVVDYVPAHETVPPLHQHHSQDFWGDVGRVMPDYEARRARQKEPGPSLVW